MNPEVKDYIEQHDLETAIFDSLTAIRKLNYLLMLLHKTAQNDFSCLPATVDFDKAGIYIDCLEITVDLSRDLSDFLERKIQQCLRTTAMGRQRLS